MKHSFSPAKTGTLTIILTLIAWSSIPLFLKHFADSIDLFTSNGWRYGFSAFLWLPLVIVALLRKRLPKGIWRAALVPSIVNAIGQVTFVAAHYKIEPGLLAFGLRSQIIFAAVGAYILFPIERSTIKSKKYLIGAFIVTIGTSGAILLGGSPPTSDELLGILLSVVSGFLFAAYAIAVRKYMNGINSAIAFAVISQYTAAAMIVLMFMYGERYGADALDMPGNEFMWLLISAVIGIALGHVLYYMSIARLGVAVSSGVLQLHPFAVAVASFFMFSETLSTPQWVSGTIAVGGAALMLTVQRGLARPKQLV